MPSITQSFAAAFVALCCAVAGCSPAAGEARPATAAASSPAFPPVEYFGEGFAEAEKALQSKPDQPTAPSF